jgi:U3 small nucleolar RNA-associated protein 7
MKEEENVAKKKQKISEEISLPTALQRFARKKATA